jgi:hypothetical protein
MVLLNHPVERANLKVYTPADTFAHRRVDNRHAATRVLMHALDEAGDDRVPALEVFADNVSERCSPTLFHERPRPMPAHDVVAQVEFERHILKPGLIFVGTGLKPVAFKLWSTRV